MLVKEFVNTTPVLPSNSFSLSSFTFNQVKVRTGDTGEEKGGL